MVPLSSPSEEEVKAEPAELDWYDPGGGCISSSKRDPSSDKFKFRGA